MLMAIADLFPQPRHLTLLSGALDLAQRRVLLRVEPDLPDLVHNAAARVQRELSGIEGEGTYPIRLQLDPDHTSWAGQTTQPEAYFLELNAQEGTLIGASDAGLFAGCQTLRQLLGKAGEEVPALRIVDWPDFRYRGLYIESKWGPDLMTLDDWKGLVDYMAALKFNSLGVGVYGCWVTQYNNQTTEFLMLPFPDHPQLATPKTLRYYSPAAQEWQTLTYLPRMVTEDFFGDLVAYAKEQNISVRPHFNSPGHNTLIPRVYPEISAKDASGTPLGYGYCLSNPRTYELLFSLFDSVIERYLRPHDVDWFHIGLDEVTGYMGIDPAKPTEVLEPWCQCAACRERPHALQLQEYALKVCAHLKGAGHPPHHPLA
jgi:N-acetyl-beta-hexosaminidase